MIRQLKHHLDFSKIGLQPDGRSVSVPDFLYLDNFWKRIPPQKPKPIVDPFKTGECASSRKESDSIIPDTFQNRQVCPSCGRAIVVVSGKFAKHKATIKQGPDFLTPWYKGLDRYKR